MAMQSRPRALRCLLWNLEAKIRHAILWYYKMERQVWLHIMLGFFMRDQTRKSRLSVEDFMGKAQGHEEEVITTASMMAEIAD